MRQSEFTNLINKLKQAVNGKKFSNYSYGNSYRLQEEAADKAQAFSVSFMSDNNIHVSFYNLYDLQENKRGFMAYRDSKNVSSDYYSLTHKQVYKINSIFSDLYLIN